MPFSLHNFTYVRKFPKTVFLVIFASKLSDAMAILFLGYFNKGISWLTELNSQRDAYVLVRNPYLH